MNIGKHRMSTHSRRVLLSLTFISLCVFAACSSTDAPESHEQAGPQLVGEWIEVYPRGAARLSLVLNADSSASGTFTDPDARPGERFGPVSGWRIGTTGVPGPLCIRYGEAGTCQGYSIQGDTLFLANGVRTVLVRSSALNAAHRYIPTRHITLPGPGDSGYRQM